MNKIIKVSSSNKILPATNPQDYIPAWVEHLQLRVEAGEISQDTAHGYQRGAMKFLSWIKENPTSDGIRKWKAHLLKSNKSSSVNQWLAGVKAFFKWLFETKQIPYNPAALIQGAPHKGNKRHTRQPFTNTEVKRILAGPDRTTTEGKRDYAFLALMAYTADRTIESHRANIEDFRTEHRKMVLAVQGKGRTEKDEILILPHQAETAIRDWLAVRKASSNALFTSLSRRSSGKRLSRRALRMIGNKYIRAAGIFDKNKTIHSLRHAAITSAIQHHAPIEKVRGMSRHESLSTVMIYYHEVDRIEDPAEDYIDYGEEG